MIDSNNPELEKYRMATVIDPIGAEWPSHWVTPIFNLKPGDTFTIANEFKTRTFWQWLTRQPRQLQVYRVMASL